MVAPLNAARTAQRPVPTMVLLLSRKSQFVNRKFDRMSLDEDLARRLDELRDQHLFRELRRVDSPQSPHIQIGSKNLLNFSSNDYLGLANHPALKEAAIHAIEQYGAGSGASRLISGSLAPFHELESALAQFKKTEAALAFSAGYAAAHGVIGALLGKDDIIILDKLVHASIVDAAKLSGAKIRVFAHNDPGDLEDKLKWAAGAGQNSSERGCVRSASRSIGESAAVARDDPAALPEFVSHPSATRPATPGARRILIVTESVFSMDGDVAPLPQIIALKEKYGAWLMVDEAHATGLFGENGCGLVDQFGAAGRVEIQMVTLGKALGSAGGAICGSRRLADFLVNRARSFIFSTAPVPAAAAAAAAAIRLVQSDEGAQLRETLRQRIAGFHAAIGRNQPGISTAIVPIILGDETNAVEASTKLRQQNIFVPAVRYPSVARGAARLRVTLTAAHTSDDIDRLAAVLNALATRE